MAALFVIYQQGATLNSMALAGFVAALGIVIDDAVVDLHHIVRRLRQRGERTVASVVRAASSEMRSTLVFGTLVAALSVAPVFLIEGTTGLFYQPLALSYVLALAASTVVSLTVTPGLSLVLLANAPLDPRESPIIRWLERVYERLLTRSTMRAPRLAYGAVAVFVVASLAVLPFLQPEPLPRFNERDLLIQWEAIPGTSHPAMIRLAQALSRELRAIPGVHNFAAQVGRAVLSDKVVGINSGEFWVSIDPAADYDLTVAAIHEIVADYPGLIRDVRTHLEDTLSHVETGSSQDMVVRVFGRDFDLLQQKAKEVQQALSGVDGIVDLAVEPQTAEPYVEIEVDLAKAEEYGIKPGDVRRAASTLLVGIEAGSLFEEQKVFDVVVWGKPETRHSLTSVRELLIDTPTGGRVHLEDVADVRVASTLTSIDREALSRRLDVSFNVRGRSLAAVARDVESALDRISFPRESHADLLGDYSQRQAAALRILVTAIAALIGVYLLLQAAIGSWRLAALILVIAPWGLMGGVVAALIAGGGVLSLGELVALFALFGLAVHNCVALVRHYQHLEEEGEVFGPELVARGSRERVGPIVMTALVTGLAMAPFAFAGRISGLELVHPMAVVSLAGLVTSTLLNLFIVPALYSHVRASMGAPAPADETLAVGGV
jgi:Cu/Ag efflux pump CusA